MTQDADVLRPLLDRLASMVAGSDQLAVDELQRRLTRRALRVLVAGEAKRGKSTLINALLGREVLPSGVLPLTAIATTVVYGDDEGVCVRFDDRRPPDHLPLAALADLVTERGNPGNVRGLADVVVSVRSSLLVGGVELVDTPGVGSVYRHNTDETTNALERMDAAIIVLTADPPISASELRFAAEVCENAVTVFCVLNKVDRLAPNEIAEALAFTSRMLTDVIGSPIMVWPLSARTALRTTQDGVSDDKGDGAFDEFVTALRSYLHESASTDLIRSLAIRAHRLAAMVAETHTVTLAALDLSAKTFDTAVAAFTERLNVVDTERAETTAIAHGAFDGMLTDTNAGAAELLDRSLAPLLADVHSHLFSLPGSASTREADALAYVGERIQTIVNTWRIGWSAHLETAITATDARLAKHLDEQIAAVRDAAESLFSIQLPVPEPPIRLAAGREFNYRFTPDPGQFDAMAAAIRHRLPARWGRRQVEHYVTQRTSLLLDRHIGRARAGFQLQLSTTWHGLQRSLDRRFEEGAGHITQAIAAAGQAREEGDYRAEFARRQAQAGAEAARRLAEDLEPFVIDVRRASDGGPLA